MKERERMREVKSLWRSRKGGRKEESREKEMGKDEKSEGKTRL